MEIQCRILAGWIRRSIENTSYGRLYARICPRNSNILVPYVGYIEGNNKLPKSSTNANYTEGYQRGYSELSGNLGQEGSLPAHTRDDYRDFYVGFYEGILGFDDDYQPSGQLSPP